MRSIRIWVMVALLSTLACGRGVEVSSQKIELTGVGILTETNWARGSRTGTFEVADAFTRFYWGSMRTVRFQLVSTSDGQWKITEVTFLEPSGGTQSLSFRYHGETSDFQKRWQKRFEQVLEVLKQAQSRGRPKTAALSFLS